jgi:hypothetical protein
MSYPAGNIININARIRPKGLALANFASGLIVAPNAELPGGFAADTYRVYSSMQSLSADFADTTETYKTAERWLGGIPTTRQVYVWGSNSGDLTKKATLDKIRNVLWWYWTFFTAPVLAVKADVLAIAAWCETNGSFFVNNQTGASATEIRDPNDTDDIATQLTTLGYRHAATVAHATDGNAGNALAKHFAAVNYSATNSTITGEYKKSPGVASEDLGDTEYFAMEKATKRVAFYTTVDNQGSVDIGRWKNTVTHSTYGEFIDDVVNLDAFINSIRVALYNMVANQTTKLGQDPVGQAMLNGAARTVGVQYVGNGYLGPRNYIDPDDGVEKYTPGFEILTKPEDILDLSDPDRDARKSAPIRIRLFRKGAIHIVDVDLDIY